MFYLVPPAGSPITIGDIFRIKAARMRPAAALAKFTDQIKNQTRIGHCFFVNSGRSAQTLILEALKELAASDKNEVVIPAYTCYSVPASIVRAGLKIRIVDIDPETLDYNYDQLRHIDFSKVLAVNASNLFGLVSNWRELNPLAKEHNVYLIDDAAQTMGAYYDNKPSGSFGDVGFFSLDRGKNLSTFAGGVLVTNNEHIAERISSRISGLKQPGLIFEASLLIKIITYSLMLRPHLYWLPEALPFLGLGETVYDETFAITKLSKLQIAAGAVLYHKLDFFNRCRAENARRLAEPITAFERYTIPGFKSDNCPAFLRLPVLADNKSERDRIVKSLGRNKIKATVMYPDTIRNIKRVEPFLVSEESDFPGARAVVERLFTLPTHPYVRDRDIKKIIGCLEG
ncbi:MAG: DegT/DnrJ/EryC1/StrS family aminotransferase [candidate division Zixibacteria bacterium]|nr:DegT/DnrJ/EryC1/StrS family aminotransferase [candidate division Zixibacteria bacterium]